MYCSCFPRKNKKISDCSISADLDFNEENYELNFNNNNNQLGNPLSRKLPQKYDDRSLDSFDSRRESQSNRPVRNSVIKKENSNNKRNIIEFYSGEEFSNWKHSIDSKLLQTESMRGYLMNCFKSYEHLPEDLERLCQVYNQIMNFDCYRQCDSNDENQKELLKTQLRVCENQSIRINQLINHFNDVISKAQKFIIHFVRIDEKLYLVNKSLQRSISPKSLLPLPASVSQQNSEKLEENVNQANNQEDSLENKTSTERQPRLIRRNYRPPFSSKTFQNSFKSFQVKKHAMDWILKPVGFYSNTNSKGLIRSPPSSKEKPPWVFN